MKRDSFIFYGSWVEAVKELPNDIRLEIYDGIIEYAMTGNLPEFKPMAKIAFNFIKNDLDRNADKYSEKIKLKSESGRLGNLKRYNKDLYELVKSEQLGLEQAEELAKTRRCEISDSQNSQNSQEVANLAVDVDVDVDVDDIIELPNGNCLSSEISPEEVPVPKPDKIDFGKLLQIINKNTGRDFKVINENTKKKFRARLKDGYTKETILTAIKNAPKTDYHKNNNCQYLTPEFFSRADSLDKYGNKTKVTEVKPVSTETPAGVWNV
ncbi:DUF6291 domain-containing protein [uncultured Chryseobacterium sp.]|uniref:DUF6291 domain-containing protein n=1 Tax=uncultured Chryseobacterium sp. TaxID=259322 RepID=UPI0025CEE254|nr:DUF6291 domain-containing protein [uncultured Chryseobacterium sp.]